MFLRYNSNMKKFIYAAFFLSFFNFVACEFSTDSEVSGGGSKSGELVSAADNFSEEYKTFSFPNIIEVSPTKASLTISGLPLGKTIWLTKTNPTENIISSNYTRYVDSATGLELSQENSVSNSSSEVGISAWFPWLFESKAAYPCTTLALNANFLLSERISSSRALVQNEPLKAVAVKNYSVGDAKKIFVDTNSAISTYAEKNAILRAKGAYCYIWVVDEKEFFSGNEKYWTTGELKDGGQQINSEIAQKIAENFDKIYPMVRRIFGNESDKIIYQATSIVPMKNYSDTGTMINIVVYDIGADYSKISDNGTIGYFSVKDYYANYQRSVAKYSNKGKYFYIDAYYTANKTSMIYSTLAHEFQHMVDFGVKTMTSFENSVGQSQILQSASWYNEMKSMLCEDIMKEYLEENNSDFSDDDSPFQRLPLFCRHYYDTGLEYKNNGTYDVYFSYANNYAFGAWAARNYGGISFINKIATNSYVDIDSITVASGVSITEMLKNYTAACLFEKENYGFNKELTQTEFCENWYYYPLDSINLWNLQSKLKNTYSDYKKLSASARISSLYSFNGPFYFSYNAKKDLRPYGFMLSKVGKTTNSTVTLNFNKSNIDDAQKTYIIIE